MIIKFNGEDIDIPFSEEMTVFDLKEILASIELQDIECIRLVSSNGKVLKNPSSLVKEYGIGDESCLYMNLTSSNITSPTGSLLSSSSIKKVPSKAFGPGLDQFIDNMDPAILQEMFTNNPHMQKILEKQPELRHMFNDKKFMKQMFKASTDPEAMLQMQKSNDLALAQLENIPGGFQALTSFYKDIQEPLDSLGKPSDISDEERQRRNRELQQRLSVGKLPENHINNVPLPNPWGTQKIPDLNFAQQRFPVPMSHLPSSHLNIESVRDKYKSQMEELVEMGFPDREANLKALIKSGGNLSEAIDFLVQNE